MGTMNYVACGKCMLYREIGKTGMSAYYPIRDRQGALDLSYDIEDDRSFATGLAVSFLAEHAAHKCFFFSDIDMDVKYDNPESIYNFLEKEKNDFWKEK